MTFSSFRLLLLCVAASACRDAPVAPATPPEGVPVTLQIFTAPASIAANLISADRTIVAKGDSIVMTATLSDALCTNVSATAGRVGGLLVVTITKRPRMEICILPAGSAVYRTVVRPAPSGRYTAVLRQRFESPTQGPQEQEVVRAGVVVP